MYKIYIQLASETILKNQNGYYFLYTKSPLRIIYLNYKLYQILLKLIQNEISINFLLEKYVSNPQQAQAIIYSTLSLVTKRYLKFKLQKDTEISQQINPFVSIIIPVKNRPKEISSCLASILAQNYPLYKYEIIVVDDFSTDHTREIVKSFPVKLLVQPFSCNASACRNWGAREAKGEILVFVDSDCVTEKDWLEEGVTFLSLPGIDALGGEIEGHNQDTSLERYEASCSPLRVGKHLLFDQNPNSTFYVPSCNLFIKKECFTVSRGFEENLEVGEDVDLCWRLRKAGYMFLYVPCARLRHNHRTNLLPMLRRRVEYGMSEGLLYKRHQDKHKSLSFLLFPFLTFLTVLGICLYPNLYWLTAFFIFLTSGFLVRLKKNFSIYELLPFKKSLLSIINTYGAFFYYTSFHLVRYYLILLLLLGFFDKGFWIFGAFVLLVSSAVDYIVKRPNLHYLKFLYFYTLEHTAYQLGVILGSIKNKSFRAYLTKFR